MYCYKYIKYFFSLITYIFFLVILNFIFVNAKANDAPQPVITFEMGNVGDLSISNKSTCNKWYGPGKSCTVIVNNTTSKTGMCSSSTATVTATKDGSYSVHGTGTPQQGSGSSSVYCNWSATVRVDNFDTIAPKWHMVTDGIQLSGATCNRNRLTGVLGFSSSTGSISSSSASATCSGTVTAKAGPSLKPYDGESGVAGSSWSTKCKPGTDYCNLTAVDNVGNKQSTDAGGSGEGKSLKFSIYKDTTKCSATTISITGGTNYNGYYVGSVTCTAKCTKDNLKVGSSRTGTTTGTTCSAKACDAAGNCTNKSISVKRDKTAPTCKKGSITSEGTSNGYRLGKVTAKWTGTDGQTGLSGSNVYSKSTNDNTVTSLGNTIKDKAGNRKTCPTQSWKRDNVAPTKCAYSQSDYSNSSVTVTAWCSEDKESGCSNWKKQKKYTGNGTYSGSSGINVYDKTEQYSAAPKNSKQCSVTVNRIDKAAPTCQASLNIANPVLSANKKTWTTNTWHNNQDYVYDENGNRTANSKKRVQATLSQSSDNATSGGGASGVKDGFVPGKSLSSEAYTQLNEGSQNGVYTVFVRDKVVDTVTNGKRGWNGATLYAHGTTTTGNVGSCSANVTSFDNTNPVAHIQLLNKSLAGNYSVWSGSNTPQNVSTSNVNNNQNSSTFWSSVDITVQYWGTDPAGGNSFTGNTYNGRSGIKRLCTRMKNNNVNGGALTAWSCQNISDQQDGNATDSGRYRTVTVPAATYSGVTTVYAKVQDWAGNWSSEVSQNVYIDTTAPKAVSDSNTSKGGFTETSSGQNYNSMKNPIYNSETLVRPWVNVPVNSVFKGTDNTANQYAGSYHFGYLWTNREFTDAELNKANWYYYNNSDKSAGIANGTTSFSLPGTTNPLRTDYYYLYTRVCDNVKIGPSNCQIFKSKLVRFDNDKPRIDNILDITQGESDNDAMSVSNGHGWTNKLKVKITTHDEPTDALRSEVVFLKFQWNTNNNTDTDDKSQATFDNVENAYPNASTPPTSYSENGWTYVKCTNEDADANYCSAEIDFNTFVKNTSPVNEGWRFLKIAIVDKAGNVSGDNGIVYGPFRFDITPPEITGLEFRGHRADNGAEIKY